MPKFIKFGKKKLKYYWIKFLLGETNSPNQSKEPEYNIDAVEIYFKQLKRFDYPQTQYSRKINDFIIFKSLESVENFIGMVCMMNKYFRSKGSEIWSRLFYAVNGIWFIILIRIFLWRAQIYCSSK